MDFDIIFYEMLVSVIVGKGAALIEGSESQYDNRTFSDISESRSSVNGTKHVH